MNQRQTTHGFLPASSSVGLIKYYAKRISAFLLNNNWPTYTSDIEKMFPDIENLIDSNILNLAKRLLQAQEIQLMNVELHYMPTGSSPIPPHQDNFYHCVADGAGLKFLVPFSELSINNGGLVFLDCNSSIGVQPHSPSNIRNFSSFISDDLIRLLPFSCTSYNYKVGDISYHLLNSIHYSYGNQGKPVMFLVFRYQPENYKVSLEMEANSMRCVKVHKKLLE